MAQSPVDGGADVRRRVWRGRYVAVGERNSQEQFTETHPALVLTSRDGLRWTHVPQRASGPVMSMAHGAGRFAAVTATGNALIAEDGDLWRTASLDVISWYQPDFLAIAYDGGRFVVTQSARFSTLDQ